MSNPTATLNPDPTAPTTMAPPQPAPLTLPHLPQELLLHILAYLDIPDLLPLSRTSHLFRHLTLDPLLHVHRLHRASAALNHYIPLRPPLSQLLSSQIYITRTTMAARKLGRKLVGIRLNKRLRQRPSVEEMVQWGVLPRESREKPKWGRRLEIREAPTRAKVLGLRRFWEKVGSEGVPG
ncbi:hypothetical protein NA56DRAFT_326443 [Hyaloscypha hepaticicola]|uniref:F-box domain-containing protein n=1 Tax=Hyaloscypha hepaticicola TaxID=2082293 RepID=A0A2J6PPA0_9HELO|nr:hypothetical protein NA56DRAFT_326443 [Hyaloscypha hepaticicola]